MPNFQALKISRKKKKVWLHLIWLCFITSPPPLHYQASSLQVFSLGGQMFLLLYVRAIYVEIRSYYYYYLFFGTRHIPLSKNLQQYEDINKHPNKQLSPALTNTSFTAVLKDCCLRKFFGSPSGSY